MQALRRDCRRREKRSSDASIRAWIFAVQAVNSFVVVGTGEVFQRVFFEHLHLLLRAGEDPWQY